MKKIFFVAAVFLIVSASACQKDATVAPSKSLIKKAATKDASDDTKRVGALDGNPAL